jgi:hypothetical protein
MQTKCDRTIKFSLASSDFTVEYVYEDTLLSVCDGKTNGIALEVTPEEARCLAMMLNAAANEYEQHEAGNRTQ